MDKKEIYRLVGLKIRELRIEKNLSLTELPDKLDVGYNNLIRIEKGRTNPTLGTLCKICEVLEVKLAELLDVE
ncbi:MAG: helix-turn-helix domain-containing protein [Dysgonamonadaceae bacterium]|jgi:transcriptional regulator with XRE-family HTH domain|nr:helix-turn-helix domain-containing protein [Dysgonamonadaceae bacterium]